MPPPTTSPGQASQVARAPLFLGPTVASAGPGGELHPHPAVRRRSPSTCTWVATGPLGGGGGRSDAASLRGSPGGGSETRLCSRPTGRPGVPRRASELLPDPARRAPLHSAPGAEKGLAARSPEACARSAPPRPCGAAPDSPPGGARGVAPVLIRSSGRAAGALLGGGKRSKRGARGGAVIPSPSSGHVLR